MEDEISRSIKWSGVFGSESHRYFVPSLSLSLPLPLCNYNIALCFGNSGYCNDYNRQPAGIRTKRCISVHLRKQMQCTLFPKLRRVALQEIISITYAWNGGLVSRQRSNNGQRTVLNTCGLISWREYHFNRFENKYRGNRWRGWNSKFRDIFLFTCIHIHETRFSKDLVEFFKFSLQIFK